jgi:hypothetical protein
VPKTNDNRLSAETSLMRRSRIRPMACHREGPHLFPSPRDAVLDHGGVSRAEIRIGDSHVLLDRGRLEARHADVDRLSSSGGG